MLNIGTLILLYFVITVYGVIIFINHVQNYALNLLFLYVFYKIWTLVFVFTQGFLI